MPIQQTIVITGGTGGIGLHTATGLARAGARVIVTGRDTDRGQAAVARIRAEADSEQVELVTGDLSDVAGTDALAAAVEKAVDRIDVLIHNAGLMAQERRVNADGLEVDFAVNVVAPYRLTQALLPLLEASTPSRVLVLTGGKASSKLLLDDLMAEERFTPLPTYSNSKRAAEAMALALARELDGTGISVHIVYPGRASTAMTRAMTPSSLPLSMRLAWPLFRVLIPKNDGGKSAEKASKSSIYAATSRRLEGETGVYIDTRSQRGQLHASVHDLDNQERVMAIVRGVCA